MLLNPAASQAVRPTPGIPALTSRAGASLSFVFPTPPAASRQPPRTGSRSSRSQPRSSEHTGAPELREMLGGARSRLTDSVCCFQSGGPRSARSLVQVAHQPPCTRAPGACVLSLLSRGCRPLVRLLPRAGGPPAATRARSRSSRSAVSSVRVRGLSAPPCRWLSLPGALTRRLPPPSD